MKVYVRTLVFLSLFSIIAAPAYADGPRGVVEAVQRTVLSSELSGVVTTLPKRAGDRFSKGETLAKVGCALYLAERDKVDSRLRQAQRSLENKQRLADLDSVGRLDVELAELAVEERRAELKIARLNTQRCQITAPFDGRVVKRHASEYQSVQAQQKLLEIVGLLLEARVIVPAEWLMWLEPGDPMTFEIEETDTTALGEVVRIGAVVDPVSHTVPVWTRLSNEKGELRPGMSGTANFQGRTGDDSE